MDRHVVRLSGDIEGGVGGYVLVVLGADDRLSAYDAFGRWLTGVVLVMMTTSVDRECTRIPGLLA